MQMSDLKDIAISVGSGLAKELIAKLGNAAAEGLLNGVVDLIGEAAATQHINQYQAWRVAADAAEAAKFGNKP